MPGELFVAVTNNESVSNVFTFFFISKLTVFTRLTDCCGFFPQLVQEFITSSWYCVVVVLFFSSSKGVHNLFVLKICVLLTHTTTSQDDRYTKSSQAVLLTSIATDFSSPICLSVHLHLLPSTIKSSKLKET